MHPPRSIALLATCLLVLAGCPANDDPGTLDDDPMIEVDPHRDVPEPDDEELEEPHDEADPDTVPVRD